MTVRVREIPNAILVNYTKSKQNAERNMERQLEREFQKLLRESFPPLYNKPITQNEEVATEESKRLLKIEINHLKRVQGSMSEYD